jgi:hypothetical protein
MQSVVAHRDGPGAPESWETLLARTCGILSIRGNDDRVFGVSCGLLSYCGIQGEWICQKSVSTEVIIESQDVTVRSRLKKFIGQSPGI